MVDNIFSDSSLLHEYIAKIEKIRSIEPMDDFGKIVAYVGNVLLFVLVSIIFLPSFLIVTYLQEFWSKRLSELFGY